MSKCLTPAEIEGLLADTLSPDEKVRAEAHLAACERCRQVVERGQEDNELFGKIKQAYEAETVSRPEDPGNSHPLPGLRSPGHESQSGLQSQVPRPPARSPETGGTRVGYGRVTSRCATGMLRLPAKLIRRLRGGLLRQLRPPPGRFGVVALFRFGFVSGSVKVDYAFQGFVLALLFFGWANLFRFLTGAVLFPLRCDADAHGAVARVLGLFAGGSMVSGIRNR